MQDLTPEFANSGLVLLHLYFKVSPFCIPCPTLKDEKKDVQEPLQEDLISSRSSVQRPSQRKVPGSQLDLVFCLSEAAVIYFLAAGWRGSEESAVDNCGYEVGIGVQI